MKDTFTIDTDLLKKNLKASMSSMAKGQDKIAQLIKDALLDKD